MMFRLELNTQGMELMTPLFGVTISFMRRPMNADRFESGIIFRWGGLRSDEWFYTYPHNAGFMWVLARRALMNLKEAVRFEVYQ